jgi:acyl-CoA synthetase (AMP-forming)/AMP-acid ligase II
MGAAAPEASVASRHRHLGDLLNTAEFLLKNASDDAVAIVDSAGAHTYGALRVATAARMEALGELAAGSPVAIVGANSLSWVAAYLAALGSGMVAVPIPNTLPAEQIADRVRWIGATAVLLGKREERLIARHLDRDVLVVPENIASAGLHPDVVFAPSRADADAVYAFTSGTTGVPRAVRLTHGNLQANTESILAYLPLASDERVLVVLPFSYVFGASLMHTHLRIGGTLVIQPNVVFPQAIVDQMRRQECTGLAGVPSTFHVLLRNSTFRRQPLEQLRTIQQAGGKLAPVLVDELVEAQPQATLYVMYGQTEATARLSYLPPTELPVRRGSIGRGIPGVTLRVADADGNPTPQGEVGEIWASGANISPGYLRDPEATQRKMPRGELRTGDLAFADQDGYLFIVDRQEDFIKSWGFRIASQEVESVAMQIGDLIAAAAVGVPDDAAGERLELVVVRRPTSALTADVVLRHCREHLAKHMVPTKVHFASLLPLNANGKVSKTAVRQICLSRGAGAE